MFGKRWREREERGRQITVALFAYMDEQEAYSWAAIEAENELGPEAAAEKYPPPSVVETVGHLMELCSQDVETVMNTLEGWYKSAGGRFAESGNEDRAAHVSGVYMSVCLTGIGNLFGYIPEEAPAFDPDLAAAGRQRGWRA